MGALPSSGGRSDGSSRRLSKRLSDSLNPGQIWTGIYFDPRADTREKQDLFFSEEELRRRLGNLIGGTDSEHILKIQVYKTPLHKWQLTQVILYHEFVVLKTDKWWWSVEKNDEGITIQRSKYKKYVKNFYRRQERNSRDKMLHEDCTKYDLLKLVEWIWLLDHLYKPYNYFTNSCKDFAEAVFHHVAKKKAVGSPVREDLPVKDKTDIST